MRIIPSFLNPLILDNPVLDYLSRRAWRRYRRWGWVVGFLPLSLVGWRVFMEIVFLLETPPSGAAADLFTALYGGLMVAVLTGAVCIFSLGGVARLLRPEVVEPLFLTQLAPAQIWSAALINMNRNLLILGAATLPILLPCAALARLSVGMVLREAALLVVLANLWTLIFCVWALQWGFRFAAFFAAGLLLGYLIFAAFPFFDYLFGRGPGVPFVSVLHLFFPVFRDWQPILSLDRGPVPFSAESFPMRLSILGWGVPYEAAFAPSVLLIGLALAGLLLAGPMRLPSPVRRDSERVPQTAPGKGLGGSLWRLLWRWAANPLPAFSSPTRYTWRQISDRLYENSPAPLRRRWYLAKNLVAALWWVLLTAAVIDLFQLEAGSRPMTDGELKAYLNLLAIFGLLAGLHFAYAGAPEGPGALAAPRFRARLGAYAFKIAVVLVVVWIAGASRENTSWAWPAMPFFTRGLAFVVLILASQAAFQLWVSAQAREAAQAVSLGLGHALAVWIGPLLLMPFMRWAPLWLLMFVSISPSLALADMCVDLDWTIPRHGPVAYGVYTTNLDLDWRWSALFLTVDLLIFGALLAARRRRSAKP